MHDSQTTPILINGWYAAPNENFKKIINYTQYTALKMMSDLGEKAGNKRGGN